MVPVTFTTTVHEAFTATLPPVRLMPVDPATAVAVPVQVFNKPFGVDTTSPAGSVSVNATPVSATVFAGGFATVKVRVVVPFRAIVVGLKAFAITGGATTMRLAEAVPPAPPSVDVTAPVVLFFCPAEVPVTFTEKVHEVLWARAAPVKLITLVPAVAVIVPAPQLPSWPFGVAITRPAGNVSLKLIPDKAWVVLLF
jgi:hypothetical protein